MTSHYVAGVFRDVASFKLAFDALIEDGFAHRAVSVLAARQALHDQFGDNPPTAGDPTEQSTTPDGEAAEHGVVRTAIHFFAEGLATIGMIGAAGVAYAVGGPIGLAATAGDSTELSVENFLADYVEEPLHGPYEEAIQKGGVACWVSTANPEEENRARQLLTTHHAEHVHILTKN